MNQPSDDIIAAWITLQTVSRTLLEEVDTALASAGLPDLSWYDALLEIEKAGEAGVRPFQLKDRLLLPQYGTSRLLDRIERAGLIARRAVKEDGRGHLVVITDEGRRMRRKMWPIYAAALQRLLGKHLSVEEATSLRTLLLKLKRR
jgi:DNA-binding MarR family transcriptional regulator